MAEAEARPQTAAGRYAKLEIAREPFLRRARQAASLTIPGLYPPPGTNGSTDLPQPFQSVGADGVNNLASKLLIVLFPPGASCFRLEADELVMEELATKAQANGEDPTDAKDELDEALAKVERAVTNRMEGKGVRITRFEAILHLIVGGNGLIHVQDDGSEKFFPLDSYVVKRDLSGNVLEILTKECLTRDSLPADARALVKETDDKAKDSDPEVDLYTWVQRKPDGAWSVHQEIEGSIIPNSEGTYPKDKCAWIPLRWRIVSRNDYGRGRCEEYIGDLFAVDTGSESVLRFGAAVAKILFFADPGGQTDPEECENAKSGDFLPGNAKDLSVLMVEKTQDFTVLKSIVDEAKHRLEKAFLLASSVQRNAERVTAEEIRAMIGQLEESLGGVYALLSEEMQRPLVVRHLHELQVARKLPPLPSKLVTPQIITGLEGLGRNTDLNKLRALTSDLGTQFTPEKAAEYFHIGNYARRMATALGISVDGIVRTDAEVEQNRQQATQNQIAQNVAPHMVQAGVEGAKMGMAQQAAPATQ